MRANPMTETEQGMHDPFQSRKTRSYSTSVMNAECRTGAKLALKSSVKADNYDHVRHQSTGKQLALKLNLACVIFA
jgi:hypothetical protein